MNSSTTKTSSESLFILLPLLLRDIGQVSPFKRDALAA